ncbi:adenylate/guanylate cyclase domain-containing protein [Winogradskyella sp. PG-2]|uniref:adenylate/guanylate cyclase domain-containing protein n=1 Tax=Winogradskyella sp. PG-2 TaxID=754409 RepID=UPI00045890E8|nr:adenylate/guanylate cyclase domain-containing protein [Winogradskyella sp. PG-2]BAO74471.1 adenylate cyclase [Winogradskyella sp. PG-2]
MNIRLKVLLELVFTSIIFWVIAFFLFSLIRYNGIEEELSLFSDDVLNLPIRAYYEFAIIVGFLLGLVYAIIEFLFDIFISKRLALGISILVKSIIYFVLIIVLLSTISLLVEEQIDIDLPNERGWWRRDPFFWTTVIYSITSSIVFSLIRIANDKFGRGIFINVLIGKYRKPQEEERILMFLDLKDSTKIAEKLGHIEYSKFIQDCFIDLNRILSRFEAEVYQYVGDEAVLSWLPKKGFKNNNCISMFFAFEKRLNKREDYYAKKYNHKPEFKAGIHCGKIMVTEVRYVKKEIAYHGDVINTAARLQKLCNTYNKSLLVSKSVLNNLSISETHYQLLSNGIALKGKKDTVEVYAL